MKSLIYLSIVLAGTALMVSCARSPDIEFEPAEQQQEEPPVESQEQDEEPTIEAQSYPEDVVSSAEQLYGADPGGQSPIYLEALEKNPNLAYTVIYFDFDSYELSPEMKEMLSHHADFMKEHTEVQLVVEGHTDKRGTAGYNLALGERRAVAVKNYLQTHRVDGTRIRAMSYGEERPAVEGDGEEIYSRNRRAEMIYR